MFRGSSSRTGRSRICSCVRNVEWPGHVICMYVCGGTMFRALGPTDPLVVAVVDGCILVRGPRSKTSYAGWFFGKLAVQSAALDQSNLIIFHAYMYTV
jgi:hypothetical protein